jgi:hypothetical protein
MEKNFMDYRSGEVAQGLKKFLGRYDTYGVRWLFLRPDCLLVRFKGFWEPVRFEQIKPHLATKKPGP